MKQNYDFDIEKIKNLSQEEKVSRQKNLDLFYESGFPSKQIEDWKTTELITVAQQKNTRVLLTVSLHGKKNNNRFLSNELLWNNLYEDVGKLVLDRNADGIDINFEDIPDDLKNKFIRFVTNFRKSLGMKFKSNNREAPYISLTLPSSFAISSLSLLISIILSPFLVLFFV